MNLEKHVPVVPEDICPFCLCVLPQYHTAAHLLHVSNENARFAEATRGGEG